MNYFLILVLFTVKRAACNHDLQPSHVPTAKHLISSSLDQLRPANTQMLTKHRMVNRLRSNNRSKTTSSRASRDPTDKSFHLLQSSSGDGNKEQEREDTQERQKTLSDQVKEGKYGLIQNELFSQPPKQLGVLSYDTNSETANDNKGNYGGLELQDIWLSEKSLLVLKGGTLNSVSKDEPWKPIDGYKAGKRPVKIPHNPKTPPPFPVQLDENGPIEFLGQNPFPIFNPFTNESINLLSPQGVPKAEPFLNPFQRGNISFISPPVLHSLLDSNQSLVNPFLNFISPPFGGDPKNDTDFDEDDPSLYYPPPYSFEYNSNYTNPVPPGPLVPGIVLPPPPNFFTRLHNTSKQLSQDVITRLQKINHTKLYMTSTKPTKPRTTTTILKITPSVEVTRVKVRPLHKTTTPKPTTVYYDFYAAEDPTPSPRKRVTRPTSAPTTTSSRPKLPHTYLPAKEVSYDKYLYITPKPDVTNNGRPDNVNIQLLPTRQSHLKSFEHEIETIKQTLRYYKTTTPAPEEQFLPQKAPSTSKAIYEYSFDNQQRGGYVPNPIVHSYYPNRAHRYYDSLSDSTTEYPNEPPAYRPNVPQYIPPPQFVKNPAYISIEKQILHELIPHTGAIQQPVESAQPFRPRYQERRKPLEKVQIGNQTYIVYRIRSNSKHNPFREREREPDPPPPISLHSDINVNFKPPLAQFNPNSEFVPTYSSTPRYSKIQPPLIQYKLPGDNAHVFFLPPIKR